MSSVQKTPIGFAPVVLLKAADSVQIAATLTDEFGLFEFENVKQGQYLILSSPLGFKKAFSNTISVSKQLEIQPINIELEEISKMIDEIAIKGTKPFVEQQADKTVVNVENSVMSSGMSITEVLKRAPGVSVDKDGQIKIKGKEGVLVMIDNKPMYMDAAQLGNILKSLSADQVKSIEISTNPSAKYDAAGNAGIVNIKLKKAAFEGYNGSFNSSYGQGIYSKASSGFNFSYQKDKISISSGYQFAYKKNLENWSIDRYYQNPNLPISAYLLTAQYAVPGNNHNALFNMEYKLNEKNKFFLSLSGNHYKGIWKGGSNSQLFDFKNSLNSRLATQDSSNDLYYNLASSLGFKHQFDTTGTELSFLVDYQHYNQKNNQTFSTFFLNPDYSSAGIPSFTYFALLPTFVDQPSAKVDFVKPLPKDFKLETGVKINLIQSNTDVVSTFKARQSGLDSITTNNFVYNEQISAAYAMLYKNWNKWKFQGGLRVEHTNTRGEQKTLKETPIFRDYLNLFPSAGIIFNQSDKTSYSLQYSKRIDRPIYKDLNPFRYFMDPFSIYQGNAFLLPQYTHNIEFTYSLWYGAITTILNYSKTTQFISDVYIIDPERLSTFFTKSNLKSYDNIGISLALNLPITKWWNTSSYVYGYQNIFNGDIGFGDFNTKLYSYMFNSTNNFKLPHKFDLEISGLYEAPTVFGLMKFREMWQISFGIQKRIFNDKATIKLMATDVFWTYKYKGEGTLFETQTFDSYRWDNRVVTLTFIYNFGKRFNLNQGNLESELQKSNGSRR